MLGNKAGIQGRSALSSPTCKEHGKEADDLSGHCTGACSGRASARAIQGKWWWCILAFAIWAGQSSTPDKRHAASYIQQWGTVPSTRARPGTRASLLCHEETESLERIIACTSYVVVIITNKRGWARIKVRDRDTVVIWQEISAQDLQSHVYLWSYFLQLNVS